MPLSSGRTGRPISRVQFEVITKKFLVFLKRELHIIDNIPLVLIDNLEFSVKNHSFACIVPETKTIYLSILNRHPIDVLRSLAHEVVHYKQLMSGQLVSGKTGSKYENEANAKAGELMRKYGALHPEYFQLTAIK